MDTFEAAQPQFTPPSSPVPDRPTTASDYSVSSSDIHVLSPSPDFLVACEAWLEEQEISEEEQRKLTLITFLQSLPPHQSPPPTTTK